MDLRDLGADALDARLLAAHDAGDGVALVGLYTAAANAAQDIETECFFLTHAWIFALETNCPATDELHARLLKHGRV